MKKFLVVLGVIAFAAVAWAAAEGSYDLYAGSKPALFYKGIYIGYDKGSTSVKADTLNKITTHYVTAATWDFPALSGGQVNCAESGTAAKTGIKIGDRCAVATNFGQDGGVYPAPDVNFTCRAVTNGVIFKACVQRADAGTEGTTDLPDGGFWGYTDSFQAP